MNKFKQFILNKNKKVTQSGLIIMEDKSNGLH